MSLLIQKGLLYGEDVVCTFHRYALKAPTETYCITDEGKDLVNSYYQKLVFRTSQANLASKDPRVLLDCP